MRLTRLGLFGALTLAFAVGVLVGASHAQTGFQCDVVTDGPFWTETCVRDVSP